MRKREVIGPIYSAWQQMIRRCTQPSNNRYHYYGGRGICVHERWLDFDTFLADMGPRPSPSHSIDRIDNDGDYEPGNCRWATLEEQRSNTRRNILLTYRGKTQTASRWARELGLGAHVVLGRVRQGWPVEKVLGLRQGFRKHQITIDGVTATAKEWSERNGVPYKTLLSRLNDGWPPERACVL